MSMCFVSIQKNLYLTSLPFGCMTWVSSLSSIRRLQRTLWAVEVQRTQSCEAPEVRRIKGWGCSWTQETFNMRGCRQSKSNEHSDELLSFFLLSFSRFLKWTLVY